LSTVLGLYLLLFSVQWVKYVIGFGFSGFERRAPIQLMMSFEREREREREYNENTERNTSFVK
jgi:hypothetical protein